VIAAGDTTALQNAVNTAADGKAICGNGSYGTVTIRSKRHAADVIVQSQNPDSAMTIASLTVSTSNHWKFQGLHLKELDSLGNTNVTFTHNLHTDGQFSLAPTSRCHPPGPTYAANANVVVDHSEFTHYNETNGGREGRLTLCGDPSHSVSTGFVIQNNWFHGGWAGSAGASSCSDGIDGLNASYGAVIRNNEFSDMAQGSCVTAFPGPVPHVDPIAPNGLPYALITGNWFHDNGDGSGGILAGPDPGIQVTHNLFECTCVYHNSILGYSVRGWTIQHNTFVGGNVMFQNANGEQPTSGNVVRDNLWKGGGLSAVGSYGSNDHNLNSGQSGAGNVRGTPVFVGGSNPRSYAGHRLAPGSPGKRAASDGTDIGIG
jgi:hypothetical protein